MYLHTYHKVSAIYKSLHFTGNPGIIYYMRNPGKTLGSRQKVLGEKDTSQSSEAHVSPPDGH